MARRNPWFSLETDNDDVELDQDVLGTDTELDETAVDDAGDDAETVDVTPDTKETAHNELASAGGVATGNNQDQLEMDPVAATESFCRRFLGLSREDMEEAVDEIKDAEVVDTGTSEDPSSDLDDDMADAVVQEEESGGEVVDADDTGVDNPAIDDTVTVTVSDDTDATITTTEEEEAAIENWFRSLEEAEPAPDNPQGDDAGPSDDEEDDDKSSEFWL